ncbi:MAG: shikimate dehydrogenase [Alphaproteobacteria bacterium]|nr:shikimate dehydrogenase [Alphaproteobacteria bacterium]
MGWPIGHSRSPLIHGYWLKRHGIDGYYVPLSVKPQEAAEAIRALPKLGFAGANCTVPHKHAALAAADEVDALAGRIGAANTLVVRDGRIFATNTDAEGFLTNLKAGAGVALRLDRPAVVLGAGGAARAVVVALLDAGVPEIVLVNRTRDRAETLAAELGAGRIRVASWDDRNRALAGAGLLVNTTSMGMQGQPPLELDLADMPADAVVNDIVYAPLETGLLAAARARGNVAVDGLGMLLHQAVPGFEAWFGVRPEVTAELRQIIVRDLGET